MSAEKRYNEYRAEKLRTYDRSQEFAHVSEAAKAALRKEEEERKAREEEMIRKAEAETREKMKNLPAHIAHEFAKHSGEKQPERVMTPAKAREFASYSNSLVRLMLRVRAEKYARRARSGYVMTGSECREAV